MKRILAITPNTTDLNVEWQATSFKESNEDEIKIVEGSSINKLDEEILQASKDGVNELIVLWERNLQQDADKEYGHLFDSIKMVDRQFVLREVAQPVAGQTQVQTQTNQTQQQTQNKQPQQAPKKQVVKASYHIFVLNPINAVVKGAVDTFKNLIEVLESNNKDGVSCHIFDTCEDPNINWMYGKALSCISSGYGTAADHIKPFIDVGETFSDYDHFKLYCESHTDVIPGGLASCWVVVPTTSKWKGNPNVILSGQTIPIPNKPIIITLPTINPDTAKKALELGTKILKDQADKKITQNAEKVKKWYAPDKTKKTAYLTSAILTILKEAVSGEAKNSLNKSHKTNDDELKKKVDEFMKTMGFSQDLATVGNAAKAAGLEVFMDAGKALGKLVKGKEKDPKDQKEKDSGNGQLVSHDDWEKFQALFDDQMQGTA